MRAPLPLLFTRSIAGLVLVGLLGLGFRCHGPFDTIYQADLGRFTLLYWQTDDASEPGERTFAARLLGGYGRQHEVMVAVASRSPGVVVLDASLRFGSHARKHPRGPGRSFPPIHTPNRDTFRIRHAGPGPLDPEALAFTALDRFGGILAVESTATGRFRVEEIDGRHWFITPEGHGFFSAGINHIQVHGDYSPPIDRRPYYENILELYGSDEGWAEETEERLRSWGTNTVGAWSSEEFFEDSLPYTEVFSLNRAAPAVPGWPTGQTGQSIRDYFSPDFVPALAGRVEQLRSCSENPYCVGFFSDNELPWGASVLQFGTYVDAYLTLPPGAPGKLALQAFFQERYVDVASFNEAWSLDLASFDEIQQLTGLEDDSGFCNEVGRREDRQAFVALAAERYFEAVHTAVRAEFPDLLMLGSRFMSVYTAPEIVAAAGPYVDVVSVNDYDFDEQGRGLFKSEGEPYGYLFLDDPVTDLETVHELSGRPVMITEWTIRTPTPGVDVLFPPFMPTAETQAERADRYEGFMRELLARPYMVGSHWFKYHDQPATGRGDGENSLFGVVNIEDTVYTELSERMTAVNADLHASRMASTEVGAFAAAAPGSAELGERVLSITAPDDLRTGFFIFILPGVNLAANVEGGPLYLEAGAPDTSGVAPLSLAEDAVLAFATVVGDVACLRLQAEGSSGELACDGGFGHDVRVTQAAGPSAAPPVTEPFLGEHSGPGAATLLVPLEFSQLPAGSTSDDCLTTESYGSQWMAALSTGVVTSIKGATSFETVGENFACGPDGEEWRTEDGSGMLVVGVPTFDSRVPGGDLAAAFRVADRDEACRP